VSNSHKYTLGIHNVYKELFAKPLFLALPHLGEQINRKACAPHFSPRTVPVVVCIPAMLAVVRCS
jgi:hypothetical protein